MLVFRKGTALDVLTKSQGMAKRFVENLSPQKAEFINSLESSSFKFRTFVYSHTPLCPNMHINFRFSPLGAWNYVILQCLCALFVPNTMFVCLTACMI